MREFWQQDLALGYIFLNCYLNAKLSWFILFIFLVFFFVFFLIVLLLVLFFLFQRVLFLFLTWSSFIFAESRLYKNNAFPKEK